jgi:mercuric ion binding protein
MKKLIFILLMLVPFTACGKNIPAGAKTDLFKVSGNCGMCKKKIENAVKVEGVYRGEWNKKTKIMTVIYDPIRIKLDEIKKLVAKAGYDNDRYKADSADYEDLHSCCKYERTQ